MDPITLFIVNLIIGVVLSGASTLVAQAFKQDAQKQPAPGVRGTIQTGGDNPLGFIIGKYGTAGQLEYAGTWGEVDETPNAWFTKVISLSDVPLNSLSGLYVNGERVTLGATEHATRGFPVIEYQKDGDTYLWIKFYDGTQTVIDPLLDSAFGTDTNRPWDGIGTGVAYAVLTARINRELFSGLPEYLFEVEGAKLYDPREDTTAGGAGDQRLDDPDTWAWSDNPVVAIYNILCGIYYWDGTAKNWLWGPQNIDQARLSYANWSAEMDKCDALISLADGGSEKRFRCGYEVTVDQEPHAVIGELLKACEGRIAEIGGKYRILVGEPAAAVVSITDEDLVITEGQSIEPFPGLESTYNGITATYPEPEEAWENKEAPPRYDAAFEAEDDDRRLPFSTSYKAAPYPMQVQRLMQAAVLETRRFRRHSFTAPAEWWEYEPLDVVDWTSARNGYTGKDFLITVMEDLPNGNQIVGTQEIDPSDYSGWTTADELDYDTVPIIVARPPPQPMTGWAVAPYIHLDPEGGARRPGIEVSYAATLADVRAVQVQVRNDGATDPFLDFEAPYDAAAAAPSSYIVANGILPNEPYEVRGKFVPYSGRETEWSAWLDVTTPDVRLGVADVDFGDINVIVSELTEWMQARLLIRNLQQLGSLMSEQDLANYGDKQILRREIASAFNEATAGYIEAIEVATGPSSAIAQKFETLFASLGGDAEQAYVNFRAVAEAGPAGYSARYGVTAGVTGDVLDRMAAFYLDVPASALDPTRVVLIGDQVVVTDGTNIAAVFAAGTTYLDIARIEDASITGAKIGDAEIGTAKIDDAAITSAKIDDLAVTTGKIGDLAVDTLKIAGNAVTVPASAVTTAAIFLSKGSYTTVQTLALTCGAGDVFLDFFAFLDADLPAGSDPWDTVAVQVRIKRDGVVLFGPFGLSPNRYGIPLSIPYIDTVGAGTFTYTVDATFSSFSTETVNLSQRTLRALARMK